MSSEELQIMIPLAEYHQLTGIASTFRMLTENYAAVLNERYQAQLERQGRLITSLEDKVQRLRDRIEEMEEKK